MKRFLIILLLLLLVCVNVYILIPELGMTLVGGVFDTLPSGCQAGSVNYLVRPSDIMPDRNDGLPVIVLDPGHGGIDPGAVNQALRMKEADINLSIARSLADMLSGSGRVRVYLTRETLGVKERKTLAQRVDDAVSVNADLFISLHNNSQAKNSSGTEIYVSGRKDEASQGAYLLAEEMMRGFGENGMRLRGIYCRMSEGANTDANGMLYDYYGVIRMCSEHGIPAMLVEHGFLNERDHDVIAAPGAPERIAESEYHAIMRWFGFEETDAVKKGGGDGDGSGMIDDADIKLAQSAIMCESDSPAGEVFKELDINGDWRVDSADISYIFMLKNGIACIPKKGGGDSPNSGALHTVSADREDFKKGAKIKVTVELSGSGSLLSANGVIDYDKACFALAGVEDKPKTLSFSEDKDYGLVRWCLSPDDSKVAAEDPAAEDEMKVTFVFRMSNEKKDEGYSINSTVYSSSFYDASDGSIVTYGRDISSVVMGNGSGTNEDTD